MNLLKATIVSIAKFASYLFLFVFLVLATTEIWFQITPWEPPFRYFKKTIDARLWPLWLDRKNTNPIMPPFKIFSNSNFDDEARLKLIAKETSLPRNSKLTAYDFLRPAELKEKTSYTASINNLGFRDPPRAVAKPKNVFRIIVLGSYQAFGHGVTDEYTYPRQLERMLNNLKIDGITFEVWNGGRHAASSIVGLAKLKTEVLNYHPDLIIWNFGFVDAYILGDDIFPVACLFPNAGTYQIITRLLNFIPKQLAAKSQAFSRIMHYLVKKNYPKNYAAYKMVSHKMMEITRENNIPVIFLNQTMMPQGSHKAIGSFPDHVIPVNGHAIFEKYPPSAEITRKFYSEKNWLSEFDPVFVKKGSVWWPPEYLEDIYQYNEAGLEATARYLTDEISVLVKKRLSQKPTI